MPVSAWLFLARNQLVGFVREPAAAGFNLVVPLFIVIVQAVAYGQDEIGAELPGYRVVDVLAISAAVMYIMIIGVFGMGVGLASMIESRTLSGFRLRPGGLASILSGYSFVLVLLTVLGLGLATVALDLAWGIRSPARPAVLAPAVLAGCALFLGIGACVAGVSGSPRSAQGISSAIFFPVLFLSGAMFPTDDFPPALRSVAAVLPGSHLYEILAYAWISSEELPWGSLAYVLGLAGFSAALAVIILRRRERL